MRSPISIVNVDRTDTWTRYRAGLCNTCAANCCTMPLEVQLSDLVRLGLVDPFEAEHEEIRHIAKRLQKARLCCSSIARHTSMSWRRRWRNPAVWCWRWRRIWKRGKVPSRRLPPGSLILAVSTC